MNTKSVEVSQRVEFSCCYIDEQSDKLNSYVYKFEATVCSNPNNELKNSRVISFEEFKDACNKCVLDGKFLYNSESIKQEKVALAFANCGISCEGFDGPISAERIIEYISISLKDMLETQYPKLLLKDTKLRETVNSYVSWSREKEN